jgi:hypothetical protein
MQQVADRTEAFEQQQADRSASSEPVPSGTSENSTPKASSDSAEERLKKLDGLFKKGLITKQEYEAKKADILKDI